MRRLLDGLYCLSGWVAAGFLALIGVMVTAQVIARFFGVALDSTESSGFCLAATTFLGMANTLKNGNHIRVNLLIRNFKKSTARRVELWCSGVGVVVTGYLSWQTILMVYDSWIFQEISPGLLAIPFWIPQLAMAVGVLVLTVAFVDEFLLVARGQKAGYLTSSETALGNEPLE